MLVWLKYPNETYGSEKLDKKDPDPVKRKQKVPGLVMLKNFVYKGYGIF